MSSEDEDNNSVGAEEEPIPDTDEDTIRVMLSTDNHLGYAEGDAVRGNDSFAALEEVLYLAKHYRCDLVLLSGDLFHENKPSRRTMYKAIQLFRKYCMGSDPISIQIISDQTENFRQGLVNYQNEFYSVDLPVMSIHGNHDDPSREGTELYAALDLLDCSGLVNYIGRQEELSKIQIAPVLMKKGETVLALYSLGAMRDERLNRLWEGSKLSFLRPNEEEAGVESDFFNLFTLHQNRDKGRGTKNCIHESMIPEWMDLVCWGHEHECSIEPQESVVGTFRIIQPGSSVATSLVAGEAATKKVGILDIRKEQFRLRSIPLTQVRPFVLGEISLQQTRNLDPDDPKVEEKVKRVLKEQVELLIHQAKERRREMKSEARRNNNVLAQMEESPLSMTLEKPDEALVRLKVEHSGFSALNNQRFGAQFIGQVANPTDILLFQRQRNAGQKANKTLKKMAPIEPEQLEEMNIEDLIEGELEQSEKKLELLDEKRIANALEAYVQKQQAQALSEVVEGLLGRKQKRLLSSNPSSVQADGDEPTAQDESKERTTSRQARASGSSTALAEDDASSDEVIEAKPKSRKSAAKTKQAKKTPTARGKRKMADSDLEDDPIVEEKVPKSTRPKKVSRTARKTKVSYAMSDDSMDEDNSVSSVEVVTKPKARGRKAPSRKTSVSPTSKSLSQSQLSFAPAGRSRKTKESYASSDEDWGTAS